MLSKSNQEDSYLSRENVAFTAAYKCAVSPVPPFLRSKNTLNLKMMHTISQIVFCQTIVTILGTPRG